MNLKVLADFFRDHNLIFLGFDVSSSVIRAYKNRFPNDPSATNLDQWHIYEKENPNTFVGMYQFWIQKNISSLLSQPEDFETYRNQKVLVLCDIEGAEQELLNPELAPALKVMDIIVESHECLIPGITQVLVDRFKETHQITLLFS